MKEGDAVGVLRNYHHLSVHPSVHPSIHPLQRPFKGNRVFGWPSMKGFSNSAQSVAQAKARQRRNKKKTPTRETCLLAGDPNGCNVTAFGRRAAGSVSSRNRFANLVACLIHEEGKCLE